MMNESNDPADTRLTRTSEGDRCPGAPIRGRHGEAAARLRARALRGDRRPTRPARLSKRRAAALPAAIALAGLLSACATTTPEQKAKWEAEERARQTVRVTVNPEEVRGCTSLGAVYGGADGQDPDFMLRKRTLELGGNAALSVPFTTTRQERYAPLAGHYSVDVPNGPIGEAYRCP